MTRSFVNNNRDVKVKNSSGDTSFRVVTGELVLGVDYDKIDVTYPSGTVEEYAYSLGGTLVTTIRVTYLTAAKRDLLSVEEV